MINPLDFEQSFWFRVADKMAKPMYCLNAPSDPSVMCPQCIAMTSLYKAAMKKVALLKAKGARFV